jgi:hypothetical protein
MNKFFITLLMSIILASSSSLFATEKNFDGKLGGGYAIYPDHLGLNLEVSQLWVFDPYFAAGIQSGLFWVKWEEVRGTEKIGATTQDLKARTNAYVIPALGIFQLRLPNIREKINILPYMNIGLGASIMYVSYSDPSYIDTNSVYHSKKSEQKVFGGYTWETVVGAAYSPTGSKIDFLAEVGYVGSHLYHGNEDFNMSRLIFNIGVRIPFDK